MIDPPDDNRTAQQSAETSAPPAGLGSRRLERGLSVLDCAAALKLTPDQVTALERGDYSGFAAPVFARGHLRRYLDLLDADDDLTRQVLGTAPPKQPLSAPQTVGSVPSQTGLQHLALRVTTLGIAAVTVILAALWVNDEVVGLDQTIPGPEVDPAALPEITARAPLKTDGAVAPAPVLAAQPTDNSPPSEPHTVVDPDSPPAARNNSTAFADDSATRGSDSLAASFTFEEECWAEVTDARGQRLIHGLQRPGTQVEVTGTAPFEVVLGRSGAVRITRDGVPYDHPDAQAVVRFSLPAS